MWLCYEKKLSIQFFCESKNKINEYEKTRDHDMLIYKSIQRYTYMCTVQNFQLLFLFLLLLNLMTFKRSELPQTTLFIFSCWMPIQLMHLRPPSEYPLLSNTSTISFRLVRGLLGISINYINMFNTFFFLRLQIIPLI